MNLAVQAPSINIYGRMLPRHPQCFRNRAGSGQQTVLANPPHCVRMVMAERAEWP
jgi:hypothetical protein